MVQERVKHANGPDKIKQQINHDHVCTVHTGLTGEKTNKASPFQAIYLYFNLTVACERKNMRGKQDVIYVGEERDV